MAFKTKSKQTRGKIITMIRDEGLGNPFVARLDNGRIRVGIVGECACDTGIETALRLAEDAPSLPDWAFAERVNAVMDFGRAITFASLHCADY